MADITKKYTYTALPDEAFRELFKYTDGSTVLGVITYENGDVYMGEIKPDESFDDKRDRRRHGYGKIFSKRGKTVDGEWHSGLVIGRSIKFEKSGRRTVEVRGSDPSHRTILSEYYLTEDNRYGGDRYNGVHEDDFLESHFTDILRRAELRESLFDGTPLSSAPVKKSEPAEKPVPAEKPAPVKKSASVKKAEPAEKPAPVKKEAPPKKIFPSPEEYKQKAQAAEQAGDTAAAIQHYFDAAKYADMEAVKAYLRLAVPALFAPIDRERAEKTGAKLHKAHEKLSKIKAKLFDKRRLISFEDEGFKIIQKTGCGDSPYADWLRSFCYFEYGEQRLHYLSLAAERGDYLALDELLEYYTKDVISDRYVGDRTECVLNLQKMWHFVFVLFETAERKIPWFTNKKLRYIYNELSDSWPEDNYRQYALNRIVRALGRLLKDDIDPAEGQAPIPVAEELKRQIFCWFSYMVNTYTPKMGSDFGRYYLAYMYNEGYGCDKDETKAKDLVSGDLRGPDATNAYHAVYIEHDLRSAKMSGAAAYLAAERHIEKGNFDQDVKDLYAFAAEDGHPLAYRKLAGLRLDLFIDDDEECFRVGLARYKEKNYEAALLLWRRLADKGDARCCRNVSVLCREHLSNEELADVYAKKGADLGDIQCLFVLASQAERRGQYKEAYELHQKVTEIDDPNDNLNSRGKSFLAMAEMLADGQVSKAFPVEHSYYYAARARELGLEFSRTFSEEGADWSVASVFLHATPEFKAFAMKRAVKQGDPGACMEMAIRYYRGDGVERDLVRAEELLEDVPVSTRRAYYLMCIKIARAESLYMSKDPLLWEQALQEWAQAYHGFWSLIKHDPKLQDRENMRPLMEGLTAFLDTESSEASSVYRSLDLCLNRYREKPCPHLFNLVLTLERVMLSFAESDELLQEINLMLVDHFMDGVERGFTEAVVTAEELFNDGTVEMDLSYCRCSRGDNDGIGRQVFLARYVSDLEIGWLIKGKIYGGIYIDGLEPLSVETARKYYNRVIQKGSVLVADGYFYLGMLEMKAGSDSLGSDYVIKAARMGHKLAQGMCEDQGVTW